jgi:hypothetical protein
MFARILNRIRRLVLERRYVVTLHADDELNADDLTVYDLERIILTGQIVEKQANHSTMESKYRIRGQIIDGTKAETVVKLAQTDKIVFLAVYSL